MSVFSFAFETSDIIHDNSKVIKTCSKTQEMALERLNFSKFPGGVCPGPLEVLAPWACVGQIHVRPLPQFLNANLRGSAIWETRWTKLISVCISRKLWRKHFRSLLHSCNVSTLQFSVFIRADLTLERFSSHCQGMRSFAKKEVL